MTYIPRTKQLVAKLTGSRSFVLDVLATLESKYRIVETSRFKENHEDDGVHVYVTLVEEGRR